MAAQKETAPPPPKYIIFDDFSGGMNTQFAREDLPEKALAWIENLQPIAKNKLQGVPGPADKPLTIDVRDLAAVDHSCAELFREWLARRRASGASVTLLGADGRRARLAA